MYNFKKGIQLARTLMMLLLAVLTTTTALADQVTAEQARGLAQTFVKNRLTANGRRLAPSATPQLRLDGQVSGLYVFNVAADGGFVIVSNDDATTPILGFSDSGAIDINNMPDNMRAWLQGYADEIAWLQKLPAQSRQSARNRTPRRAGSHSTETIEPMVETMWGQGYPYNAVCNGNVTGCVATAMAQVMNYHQWPESATLSGLGTTTFDWAHMKDVYRDDYTQAEIQAVAYLMRYCGQAVNMSYGPNLSTAYISAIPGALKNNFGYKETIQHKSRSLYSYDNWVDLIYNELKQGRPVIYGGQAIDGGHCFVCDGYLYDDENDTDLFWINWGWNGSCDGFFALSALDPEDQGTGGSVSNSAYTTGHEAIVGIQKPEDSGTVLNVPEQTINLSCSNIDVTRHYIALGESVEITISVKNNATTAYDGEIAPLFTISKNYYTQVNSVGFGKMVNIPAGKTQDVVFNFTPTEATSYTIRASRPIGNGNYNAFSNDISTVLVVTDMTPTNLTLNAVSDQSATIGWTNVGNASEWNLRYMPVSITTESLSGGTPTGWGMQPGSGIYWIFTPEINLGGSISFWAGGAGHTGEFGVFINTEGDYYSQINGFEATSTRQEYTVDLSRYSGEKKLAFIIYGTEEKNTVAIDDVTITEPVGSGWIYKTNVKANPYTLTGLSANTDYLVNIQANKSGGGNWSETLQLTTTMLTLADDGTTNNSLITTNNGKRANVTLSDRTLYKDGKWNTITLPFNVTLAGSLLAGATARALTAASISGTSLNLTFGNAVTTLEAGTPYIIKWDNGSNIINPTFTNVTIDKTLHNFTTSTDGKVQFKGTYNPINYTVEDKSILFMGGSNTLYYPKSGATVGACRAYFELSDANGARPTSFNISFGDDDVTSISNALRQNGKEEMTNDHWHALDGRAISQPTTKGVYIHNGKKVIIK